MSYSFFTTRNDTTTHDNHSNTTSNGSINLPQMSSISPYMNIKSLVEPPFPSHKNALREKVKQHERQYYSDVQTRERGQKYDTQTFAHSAFARNRGMNTSQNRITQLSKIGSSESGTHGKVEKVKKRSGAGVLDLNDDCVREAIGRIVRREEEVKKVLYCVLMILVVRLSKSIVKLFVYTHPVIGVSINNFAAMVDVWSARAGKLDGVVKSVAEFLKFESILNTVSVGVNVFQLLLVAIIVNSLYRLLKPVDRCLDLPLTKSQRRVLGLDELTPTDSEDDDNGESITQKMQLASQKSAEEPTKIVIPDTRNIEDVMGGLNSLAIKNSNRDQDVGNMTWSSGMYNERRDMITPSEKYLYGVNNELKNANRSFY